MLVGLAEMLGLLGFDPRPRETDQRSNRGPNGKSPGRGTLAWTSIQIAIGDVADSTAKG